MRQGPARVRVFVPGEVANLEGVVVRMRFAELHDQVARALRVVRVVELQAVQLDGGIDVEEEREAVVAPRAGLDVGDAAQLAEAERPDGAEPLLGLPLRHRRGVEAVFGPEREVEPVAATHVGVRAVPGEQFRIVRLFRRRRRPVGVGPEEGLDLGVGERAVVDAEVVDEPVHLLPVAQAAHEEAREVLPVEEERDASMRGILPPLRREAQRRRHLAVAVGAGGDAGDAVAVEARVLRRLVPRERDVLPPAVRRGNAVADEVRVAEVRQVRPQPIPPPPERQRARTEPPARLGEGEEPAPRLLRPRHGGRSIAPRPERNGALLGPHVVLQRILEDTPRRRREPYGPAVHARLERKPPRDLRRGRPLRHGGDRRAVERRMEDEFRRAVRRDHERRRAYQTKTESRCHTFPFLPSRSPHTANRPPPLSRTRAARRSATPPALPCRTAGECAPSRSSRATA